MPYATHKVTVDNHNELESFPYIGKKFGVMNILEQLPIFLESKIGVNGTALEYFIRNNDPPSNLYRQAHSDPW